MIRANGWKITQGSVSLGPAPEIEYVLTSGGAKLTDTRVLEWTDPIDHVFSIDFADAATMATFFSTGGQIRFSAARTGGASNAQNSSFTTFLNDMGTIIFDDTDTINTGSIGNSSTIGFSDLVVSNPPTTVFTASSAAAQYTSDEYKIEVFRSTNFIGIIVTLTDTNDNTIDEVVDGTLVSYIDERRHVSQSSPTYGEIDFLAEPPTSLTEAIEASAPINYWKFDETTGTTATDTMGNSNMTAELFTFADSYDDGEETSYVSTSSTRADSVGNSITIDNNATQTGNARLDNADTQDPTVATSTLQNDDFTFAWASSRGYYDFSNNGFIFRVDGEGLDTQFGMYYEAGDDTFRLIFSEDSSTQRDITLCSDCSAEGYGRIDEFWFHMEANTTTNLLKLYMNNTEVGSIDISSWSTNWRSYFDGETTTVTTGFELLAGPNGGIDMHSGKIDEFVYWNKTLTSGQRTELFNWWDMDAAS